MTEPQAVPVDRAVGEVAKLLRRARRRRRIEIWRYRLAVRVGGWVLREEVTAADQLRNGLAALVDEMTTKAAELDEDSRAMQAAGDHQAANSLTVRCGMTYFLADRLRALLEET